MVDHVPIVTDRYGVAMVDLARPPAWMPPVLASAVAFALSLHGNFDIHGLPINDSATAETSAWSWVHEGSFVIPPRLLQPKLFGELVLSHHQLYTNRPFGMILASVPGQLFTADPSDWGVALTTALLTAFSVWAAIRLWGWRPALLIAAAAPLLYTVGRTLWPETVCIPLLLTGLLVIRANRHLWSLLPLVGFATMCRPPFGLLAVLVFCIYAGRRRALAWPVAGFALGIAGMYLFSHLVFDQWELVGGYPVAHHPDWSSLWIGTVSFGRGLLWWSPWLLFVRPSSTRQRLVFGVAALYVLGSWMSYGAWAGQNLLGYRYPVPFVVLVAHMAMRPARRELAILFDLAVVWSVALAASGESLVFTLAPKRVPWSFGVPVAQTFALAGIAMLALLYYRLRLEPELARRRQVRQSAPV